MGRPRKSNAPANNVIRWVANPGPQDLLLSCPADIVCYGGAAGGGKTDALLILAALGTQTDGYNAIIFRRTYKELEKHIVERSRQLFSGIATWNEKKFCWVFPTPGGGRAHIYLAYLERDADVFNYHGAQFQFIGFDESAMFTEFQVRFMLSRLRGVNPKVKKQMVLATNPMGPGFGFHKLLFVQRVGKDGESEDLEPFKIYKDSRWPSDLQPVLKTTCFIPAKIYDNPVLLKNDPGYVDNIKSQSKAIARALLAGSWKETISMAVQFDKLVHVCDPMPIPEGAPRWIGLDWGKSDKASAVWLTSFGGRVHAYRDISRPGNLIKPFAEEVAAASMGEEIQYVVLSHETFAERGLGHTQADQFVEVLSKAKIPVVKSDKDPEGRLMLLREFLRTTKAVTSDATKGVEDYEFWQDRIQKYGEKAFKEYARLKSLSEEGTVLPRLMVWRRLGDTPNLGCPYLIKTIPLLTVDIAKPKKLADGQDDHGFDALTYGLKGYLMIDETSLLEAYMNQLGGSIPDSTIGAELAMKAAKENLAGEDAGDDEPFQLDIERYDTEFKLP